MLAITGGTMVRNFVDLEIDRSFISEVALLPSKAVRMRLFRSPQDESEKQVTQEQSLQFSKVKCCRLSLEAKPWLEVKAHQLVLDSDYLRSCLAETTQQRNARSEHENSPLHHFRMVCEEGEIDIIAEAFAFSVIDEIPFIPSSQISVARKDDAEEEPESKFGQHEEMECSFCGKREAAVAKIIAGPAANICDECVAV
jgi:hypothetical protein